jgi:hypothetical protein
MIDAYHVYLNASEVLVRRQSGWWRWRCVEDLVRWQWDAAVPASLDFNSLNLRKRRLATLTVHFGSALAKFMTLELPDGLRGEQEERAAVQAQMQHQLGLNPGQWEYTLDHLKDRRRVVACALRADIGARLRLLSHERGMRLQSIRPLVAGVWNAWTRRSPLRAETSNGAKVLMMVERDAFTIVVEKNGSVGAASSMVHRREDDLINREVRRMASLGEDAQRHIRLAVAADLLPLARLHAEKVLQQEEYLQQSAYPDFRDLLFQSPVGAVL